MTILAIDPGTRCGWALFGDDDSISSGEWSLQPRNGEPDGQRPLSLMQHIAAINKEGTLELVVFEQVMRHAGTTAAHVYGELIGAIKIYCVANRIKYRGEHVSKIKSRATGKGRASKDEMINAALEQWTHKEQFTDNEADALWILQTAIDDIDTKRKAIAARAEKESRST